MYKAGRIAVLFLVFRILFAAVFVAYIMEDGRDDFLL